jgi:hypothetical protein
MGPAQRKLMNAAVFETISVADDRVTGEVLNPPFDEIVSAQRLYAVEQAPEGPRPSEHPERESETATLGAVPSGDVSTKAILVEAMGLEPTNLLTASGRRIVDRHALMSKQSSSARASCYGGPSASQRM